MTQRIILYALKDEHGNTLQRDQSVSMLRYFAQNVYNDHIVTTQDTQGRIMERHHYGALQRWDSESRKYVEVVEGKP